MSKKINILQLINGMSVAERASLLRSDLDSRSRSEDPRNTLTWPEKEAIYRSTDNENKMTELVRLQLIHFLISSLLAELKSNSLLLELCIAKLEHLLFKTIVVSRDTSYLEELQAELRELENEDATHIANEIKGRIERNGQADDIYTHTGKDGTLEPNKDIQVELLNVIGAVHLVRQSLYRIKCLSLLGRSKFVNDQEQELIEHAEGLARKVTSMETIKTLLGLYAKAEEIEIISKESCSYPQFFDVLHGFHQSLELSEDMKDKLKVEMRRIVFESKQFTHPHN